MLYESDVNSLLLQWEAGLDKQEAGYKDGVKDCIYDLQCLMNEHFAEEALANEAFEQQLKQDEQLWDEYLSGQYAGDRVVMA